MLLAARQIPIWDAWLANDDREVAAVAANAAGEARMQWRQARDWWFVWRWHRGIASPAAGCDRRAVAALPRDAGETNHRGKRGTVAATVDRRRGCGIRRCDRTDARALPAASETVAAAVGNARLARAELFAEMQSLARQHAECHLVATLPLHDRNKA